MQVTQLQGSIDKFLPNIILPECSSSKQGPPQLNNCLILGIVSHFHTDFWDVIRYGVMEMYELQNVKFLPYID